MVRSNYRDTSVDFRGCYHGLPWKSAGFHGKGNGSRACTANSTLVATARAAVLSVANSAGINHGNPRKYAAIAKAISADIKPQPFISTAIRGHCHGNPPIHSNYHGRPRELPRQLPRTSNHSNFHGHPRQSSDTRQLPRKFTAIATAISTAFRGHPRQLNSHVNRRQFPCNHGSCNGNPR